MKRTSLATYRQQVNQMAHEHHLSALFFLLDSGRVALSSPYDHEGTLAWAKRLLSILSTIVSIVFDPAIVTTREEEIKRVETAGPLTPEGFQRTLEDPSLWKRKGKEMVPEFLHASEKVDTILTYENRFLCMLIDAIEKETQELRLLSRRKLSSLLDIVPDKRMTYSPTGLLALFGNFSAPYEDRRVLPEKDEEVTGCLNQSFRYLRRLKGGTFYHELSSFPIKGSLQPTNVLLHHPLYSRCYRFYVEELLKDPKEDEEEQIGYEDFVLLSFLDVLRKAGFSFSDYGLRIQEGKILFDCLIATKDNLSLSLYPQKKGTYLLRSLFLDKENNATILKTDRLLEIAVESDEKKLLSFRTSLSQKEDDFTDRTLVTYSPLAEEKDHVLVLRPDNAYSLTSLRLYLSSLFLVFHEREGFDLSCPVCSCMHLNKVKDRYQCPNCHALMKNVTHKGESYTWIEGLWRAS